MEMGGFQGREEVQLCPGILEILGRGRVGRVFPEVADTGDGEYLKNEQVRNKRRKRKQYMEGPEAELCKGKKISHTGIKLNGRCICK